MQIVFGTAGVVIDDQTATTEQIEDLLRQLSLTRAQMHPPVISKRTQEVERIPQFEPAMEVASTQEGHVFIALRHTGYGWVDFDLSPRLAGYLRDGLIKRVGGTEISADEGDGPLH